MIGSRWRRSCSVTQEVVTGDSPALLPLPSFSTSGPCLAFSFSPQNPAYLPLLPAPSVFHHVYFNSCHVTHAEKLWAHGCSKTLISGLKGDRGWTGVFVLIDNLQLFSFMFPSPSTAYSTYAFSPISFSCSFTCKITAMCLF